MGRGGGVLGGQGLADWPGLAKKDRFEGRDLRPTTDLRAVFKSLAAIRAKAAQMDDDVADIE